MKQNRLIPALLLFLLLCACRQGHFPFSAANYNPPSYISSIDKEDCYLCSENHREHLLWACWEQDNLGIVNLNTFDVYPVRINNYGRDGRQIKEPLGYTEIINVSLGEVRLSSTTDPDRGYSRIGIPPENTAVEPDLVGTFLCQDCLDAFASHLFANAEPSEVAVINFSTREIHPLAETCTWFTSGNYGVDCNYQEDGGIDLTLYYCPPRFQVGEETKP